MNLGLKDRVALVAASSQGIGLATAEAFAAEGCRVAMCARKQHTLQTAAEKIRKQYNAEVFAEAFDVTDAAAVSRFVAAVAEKFGSVDICVTNAGGPPAKGFLAATLEEWQRALELNFLSTVYFAQEALPRMQKNQWGRFLTITSYSVKQPVEGLLLSNSLRAGVTGLVKTLANEYGADGITVNNICPGYTRTDRLDDLAGMMAERSGATAEEVFAGWKKLIPAGRLGRPEEFAAVVAFLASERASYVNGVSLTVDGGTTRSLL